MAVNVKVAVRARPLNQRELACGSQLCVLITESNCTVLGDREKTFSYDTCYWSEENTPNFATQERVVVSETQELVDEALNGFNGCVFAYGQTGSGKSYSVFGNRESPGFIPYTVDQVFKHKTEMAKDAMKELRVWVSYLEIYNEHLHDLIHTSETKSEREANLKVHEHPMLGVYVPGLNEVPCESKAQVQKLLDFGAKKRVVAATQLNAVSSRSHAVFTLRVSHLTGPKPQPGAKAATRCVCGNVFMDDAAFCRKCGKSRVEDGRQQLHAKINLIDLAGSERQSRSRSEGEQLREACAINKSLSALGLVIKELSESMRELSESASSPTSPNLSRPRSRSMVDRQRVNAERRVTWVAGMRERSMSVCAAPNERPSERSVPFRSSKLTFLLKDSLAGNSKTQMLATISPASDSIDETVSTLRFASSVKAIKTVAVQNLQTREDIVEELRAELAMLRAQLAEEEPTAGRSRSKISMSSNGDGDRLDEQERLVVEMHVSSITSASYEAQLHHAKEMDRIRDAALVDMALTQDEISSMFGVDKMTPYLLNMSDDATLAGKLLYYIAVSQHRSIGSAEENNICLGGIGIPPKLCLISNIDNTALVIEKCGPEGRVVVDGVPFDESKPVSLHHGQRIVLGRAFAFRVAIPQELQDKCDVQAEWSDRSVASPEKAAPRLTRQWSGRLTRDSPDSELMLDGLEEEVAAIDHSTCWSTLNDYLRCLAQQMPEDQATALWAEVRKAVHICDEANDITAECRPNEGISFEVDLTTAQRMSVIVRVLRVPTHGDEEAGEQLYIWSVGQMIERLDRMRDCYHSFAKNGIFEVDALQDPWHEPKVSDIWGYITELEQDYADVFGELTQLKDQKETVLSKMILMWQGGSSSTIDATITRAAFHAWAQLCKPPVSRRTSAEKSPLLTSFRGLPVPQDRLGTVSISSLSAISDWHRASMGSTGLAQSSLDEIAVDSFADCKEIQTEEISPRQETAPTETLPRPAEVEQSPAPSPIRTPDAGARARARARAVQDVEPKIQVGGASSSSSPAQIARRKAFDQLRSELYEQRREASRLRNNRAQLHGALDRFEELLTNVAPPSSGDPLPPGWPEAWEAALASASVATRTSAVQPLGLNTVPPRRPVSLSAAQTVRTICLSAVPPVNQGISTCQSPLMLNRYSSSSSLVMEAPIGFTHTRSRGRILERPRSTSSHRPVIRSSSPVGLMAKVVPVAFAEGVAGQSASPRSVIRTSSPVGMVPRVASASFFEGATGQSESRSSSLTSVIRISSPVGTVPRVAYSEAAAGQSESQHSAPTSVVRTSSPRMMARMARAAFSDGVAGSSQLQAWPQRAAGAMPPRAMSSATSLSPATAPMLVQAPLQVSPRAQRRSQPSLAQPSVPLQAIPPRSSATWEGVLHS